MERAPDWESLEKVCQVERRRSNAMLLSLAMLRPAVYAGILPNRSGAWPALRDQTISRTRLIDAMRSDRFRSSFLSCLQHLASIASADAGLELTPLHTTTGAADGIVLLQRCWLSAGAPTQSAGVPWRSEHNRDA